MQKNFYDSFYKDFFHYRGGYGKYEGLPWYEIIREFYPPDVNDKILEIGSGYSLFLIDLANKKISSVGLDISKEALSYAKEICKEKGITKNISLLVSDTYRLPFKNSIFDMVICCEVLEHVNKLHESISEMSRVVKKEGRILISVPNFIAFLIIPILRIFNVKWAKQPIYNFFTFWRLKKLLNRYGLKVEEVRGCGYVPLQLFSGYIPSKSRFFNGIDKYIGNKKFFRMFGKHIFLKCIK